MQFLKKTPMTFTLVSTDRKVDKGWKDFFTMIDRFLSGGYERGTGYFIDPSTVTINQFVESSESSYTVPVNVQDGVIVVYIFDGDSYISEYKILVQDNVIALPDITSGDYYITGTLLRQT